MASEWGPWDDVTLFGVVCLGTYLLAGALSGPDAALNVLAAAASVGAGLIAVGLRRAGRLGIAEDGGARFWRDVAAFAAALVLVAFVGSYAVEPGHSWAKAGSAVALAAGAAAVYARRSVAAA